MTEVERPSFEPFRDELTGLMNRAGLMLELNKMMLHTPGEFSLLMIDLDDLKRINDRFGHAAGDKYIIAASEIISKSVREERDEPDVVAARIHGDEFSVVPLGVSDPNTLEIVCQRIEDNLAVAGILASIGGRPHQPSESVEALLEAADAIMYQRKQQRKTARFEALPRHKQWAAKLGARLLKFAGMNPPRQ